MGKDGTVMDLLLDRERHTGIVDPRIEASRIPECLTYLWEAWLNLHHEALRSGVMAVTHNAINAYERGYGVRFSEWERDAVIELDAEVSRIRGEEDGRL